MENFEGHKQETAAAMEVLINEKLQQVFKDSTLTFDRSRFAGGLTNYNYIMTIAGKDYVIREPGTLTEKMIDRQAEKRNTEIVSALKINSNCLFLDAETGIKISEFMPSSKNLAQADPFASASLHKVAGLLKRVHTNEVSFPNVFVWQEELKKYEEIIDYINGSLFSDYHALKDKTYAFFEKYVRNIELVPCHNDTVPENFLVTADQQFYLIDWEYSGLNDAPFDLAAFILETRLPEETIKEFLAAYYGPDGCSKDVIYRIKAYMVAQDLLWTVWALIRHYCGDNFLDYCDMRYERFRKNILALTADPNYPLAEMVHEG